MSTPVVLEDLKAAFPDWCIWRSSEGRVWATRNGRWLSRKELDRGLWQTLDADHVPELADLLREQAEMEDKP